MDKPDKLILYNLKIQESLTLEKESEVLRYNFDSDPRYIQLKQKQQNYSSEKNYKRENIDELVDIVYLKEIIIEEYATRANLLKEKALLLRQKVRKEYPLNLEIKTLCLKGTLVDIKYLYLSANSGNYREKEEIEKYLKEKHIYEEKLNVCNLLLISLYGDKSPTLIGYVFEFEYLPVVEFSIIKNPSSIYVDRQDFPPSLTNRYLLSEIIAIYGLCYKTRF